MLYSVFDTKSQLRLLFKILFNIADAISKPTRDEINMPYTRNVVMMGSVKI